MKPLRELTVIKDIERALLSRCRTSTSNIDPSAEVILYGSRARLDAEPDSDFDLLILTIGEVTLDKEELYRRSLFPIEIETGYVFTVFLCSKMDWNTPLYKAMPFCQNVEIDGIIL
jgi:predicted nucleotidyltransferase